MVYSYWAKEKGFDKEGNLLLGGLLACLTVRKASKKAFGKKFIGLTAPDVIDHIIEAFLEIYNIKK